MIQAAPEIPQAIEISIPESRAIDGRRIPTLTSLFRDGSYLSLASRLTRERVGEQDTMTVGSVGCSNGAEVDSLLAFHNESGHGATVAITGFDTNAQAIADARRGQYSLRGTFFAPDMPPAEEETLTGMGFGVSYATSAYHFIIGVSAYRLQADAASVREGHTVEFVEHDALEPLPLAETDLMVANNLLYHLKDAKAAQIARNMAATLTDRGLLSFGGSTLSEGSPLEVAPIVEMLDEEFNLEPVYADSRGAPVIFGRA